MTKDKAVEKGIEYLDSIHRKELPQYGNVLSLNIIRKALQITAKAKGEEIRKNHSLDWNKNDEIIDLKLTIKQLKKENEELRKELKNSITIK